jgi:hypothetical protein
MKFSTLILALTSIVSTVEGFKVNTKLISDFLNIYNLDRGVIFYCESGNVAQWKYLAENEFKLLSFIDVSGENLDLNISINAMKLDHLQIGAVFILTCNETEKVFEEFSNQNFFNASYNWLMVAESLEDSLEILQKQNVNLDAEISLAIFNQNQEAEIFDIYNTNPRTNGKIVTTSKGNFSESGGIRIWLTGSKFERRSNLQGVVINAGVAATSRFMRSRTLVEYMESEFREIV